MEDNNKLFVFEKKEVLLIFVFVILISITAFTLGFRAGKSVSKEVDSDINPVSSVKSNVESLELKSDVEEDADELSKLNSDRLNNEEVLGANLDDAESGDDSSLRLDDLDEKFKDLAKDEDTNTNVETKEDDIIMPSIVEDQVPAPKKEARKLSGKFTIQLVARQSQDAAAEFAEPFVAAGYDIIINEVDITGKGTWYRVSIGAFNTKLEAKEYMANENDLFQGKDYVIKQFK